MTAFEFNTQILQQRQALNNFAFGLTRNTEDASDLLQETYLRAISYRKKFKESSNLKAWLFTIMKNIFINTYRRNRLTRQLISQGNELTLNRAFQQNSYDHSETRLYAKDILKQIEKLDDDYKVPFARFYTGYKYEEIARELALPLGTIKSRIFIARRLLMNALTKP